VHLPKELGEGHVALLLLEGGPLVFKGRPDAAIIPLQLGNLFGLLLAVRGWAYG
jgi:hypothetical protein